MPRPKTVPPETLLLDFQIYPRHQVNDENLRRIGIAREAGVTLPPVVADWKSKRVIDGWHRVTDALRVKLSKITVEWRDYVSEADMLFDAAELNNHGRQLAPYDMSRCIQLAEELGLAAERLALALHITVQRLEEIRIRKTAIGPDARITPIKATLEHCAGTQLSSVQVKGNRKAGGMIPLAYVNQVINLVENDLVDLNNDNLVKGLKKLQGLLNGLFAG